MTARQCYAREVAEQAGSDWVGRLPPDWEVKRLKDIADLNPESLRENTDPELELAYTDIGGVDGLGRIAKAELISFANAPTRARRLIRHGDVIVSTVRTYLRAIAAIRHPVPNSVVSTGFAVVRPHGGVNSNFLAYALSAPYFVERVVANSKGVSFPAISDKEIATYEIALPSASDQRVIAQFLDRKTAEVDALVAKKERLIELLEEKRAAVVARAVARGLDPNVPLKHSGIDWLGEVPAHWRVKRLWHLTPSDRPIMYGIVLPGPDVKDGVPIVKGGDIAAERLRLDQLNRTAHEIEERYARSRLLGGDLVYAIRGSIGEVAVVPDELRGANLTQDAARVSYSDEVYGRWLLHALRASSVFAQLEAGALGATIRGINIRDLKRAAIPVPPPGEQRLIAAFLDRETEELDALLRKIRAAIAHLHELRTALISAAVTGKIDVREEAAA